MKKTSHEVIFAPELSVFDLELKGRQELHLVHRDACLPRKVKENTAQSSLNSKAFIAQREQLQRLSSSSIRPSFASFHLILVQQLFFYGVAHFPPSLDNISSAPMLSHLSIFSVSCQTSFWVVASLAADPMTSLQTSNVSVFLLYLSRNSSCCDLHCDATTAGNICNCSTFFLLS